MKHPEPKAKLDIEEVIDIRVTLAEHTMALGYITDKLSDLSKDIDKGFSEIKETLQKTNELDKRLAVIESKPKAKRVSLRSIGIGIAAFITTFFGRH